MDECELGSKGGFAMGQDLIQSQGNHLQLKSLSLKNNEIGDAGAARLAVGLEFCHTLERFNLSRNHINDSGGE